MKSQSDKTPRMTRNACPTVKILVNSIVPKLQLLYSRYFDRTAQHIIGIVSAHRPELFNVRPARPFRAACDWPLIGPLHKIPSVKIPGRSFLR